MKPISETAINIVSEGTRVEGTITFDQVSRVHGTLVGDVKGKPGSTLILSETAVVEGNIDADTLMVDGFVRGDIVAQSRVVVSGTGRVIGNISAPSLTIEFGAFFEGNCTMERGTS
jgi:cytoskeletal protein CcmA (bactofilin family)